MSAIAFPVRDVSIVALTLEGQRDGAAWSGLLGDRPVRQVAIGGQSAGERSLSAARIDAAMLEANRQVLLVAQGAACAAAAWWARLSPRSYVERVAGALLIAPAPVERGFASPRSILPFPTLVLGATDTAQALSAEWGARLIDGPVPALERRATNRLQSMILRFTGAIVERDEQQARRLLDMIGDS